MYTQLAKIKKHLNIDESFTADDAYLLDLAKAAEIAVSYHIDRSFADIEDGGGVLPAPIQHAILLLIGTWYACRESVSFGSPRELPHAYDYLISLYKNYDGAPDEFPSYDPDAGIIDGGTYVDGGTYE